jgi:aminopeptidase N
MFKPRITAFFIVFLLLGFTGFGQTGVAQPASGVPFALARQRAAMLKDIRYELTFGIPNGELPVIGFETIHFTLASLPADALALDFKAPPDAVSQVRVNGVQIPMQVEQEHLLLPVNSLRTGNNSVTVRFTAGNSALNRNRDFLYTLLVPDKARTLFPCFDQPDLKAIYQLTLNVPPGWTTIANAPLVDSARNGDVVQFRFKPSDRLSTYLFSFAAGRFAVTDRVVDGRAMRFLYRETDSTKLRLSIDSIFRIEGQALRFMHEYTAIDYPFQKFDFVAIPDFQFGGMEHAGAIQYKASSLFLDSGATREQLIGRSNLLSHETAHMWFGDLVTMAWFNDVWMKEVFANFMADKISSITLPDGNYDLKFLTDHYSAAYSIDRTAGAHPIRQELDNLNEAGSLYGNIIYHKAPIVMRQLERVMGVDAFRDGLRDYLKTYAGGNATWPDLIRMLQRHTSMDLPAWNAVWVNGAGRPSFTYKLRVEDGRIVDLPITQWGEDGSARIWPQVFSVALVYPTRIDTFTVRMYAPVVRLTAAVGKETPQCVILNADGQGYGRFAVDGRAAGLLLHDSLRRWNTVTRAATYINFYENMLAGEGIRPEQLLEFDRRMLAREPEELDLNILLEQVNSIFWRFLSPAVRDSVAPGLEEDCWQALQQAGSNNEKKLLFRTYTNIVSSQQGQGRIYTVWKNRQPPPGVKLSEEDYTGLAAALALRDYPGSAAILEEQGARIQNKDRKERWQYLQPSLSNDAVVRDRFFATLKDASARRKEAWVLSALGYLHHPLRVATSEKYLAASLDWLEDIQRTGDVFFPQSWLQASFGYYQTPTAAAVVRKFLAAHPGYNPKLKAKILQATDNLFRAEKLVK